MHRMFGYLLYFGIHIIPSIWRKAIICRILNHNTPGPRKPLNYRGISLQCAVADIQSSVLSNRFLTYFENHELFVNKDHVFTLDSVAQNSNSGFVAFIDLHKPFDSVDRELLEHDLLKAVELIVFSIMQSNLCTKTHNNVFF